MDNIICPSCSEETYIYQVGKIGNWQWWRCDVCDQRHWRNIGGITKQQKDQINRAALYAAIERDQKNNGR